MNKELELIFNKIQQKEPFALIRFGDGEKNILNNIACKRQGFSYDPGDIRDNKFQHELHQSLQYDGGENYFVGINHKELEEEVKGTLISPMVFVNENYLPFLRKLNTLSSKIPIILVVNKVSKFTKIPFPFRLVGVFGLNNNAWRTEKDLHEEIIALLDTFSEPVLILVAGGAYSCSLIHKIWEKRQLHMAVDIGSTLDPFLFGKNTRQYQERL